MNMDNLWYWHKTEMLLCEDRRPFLEAIIHMLIISLTGAIQLVK